MKKYIRNTIIILAAVTILILTLIPTKIFRVFTAEKDYINLPILVYHEIKDEYPEGSYTIISKKKFRKDMEWLKSKGFETIFLHEAADWVEKGTPLPSNIVAITFDDGYLSTYEIAYPILKELGMKATVALIGQDIGADKYSDGSPMICPYMSWEQAQEIYESGVFDVQSHTYGMHRNSGQSRKGMLPKEGEDPLAYSDAIRNDYNKMQALIGENTGSSLYLTAYPYGFSSPETDAALKDAGCRVTLGTGYGTNELRMNADCLYNLNRIGVFEGISMRSIKDFLYH